MSRDTAVRCTLSVVAALAAIASVTACVAHGGRAGSPPASRGALAATDRASAWRNARYDPLSPRTDPTRVEGQRPGRDRDATAARPGAAARYDDSNRANSSEGDQEKVQGDGWVLLKRKQNGRIVGVSLYVVVNGRRMQIHLPPGIERAIADAIAAGKDVTIQVQKIATITRIVIFIDGKPVWEVHVDARGKVVFRGPPAPGAAESAPAHGDVVGTGRSHATSAYASPASSSASRDGATGSGAAPRVGGVLLQSHPVQAPGGDPGLAASVFGAHNSRRGISSSIRLPR